MTFREIVVSTWFVVMVGSTVNLWLESRIEVRCMPEVHTKFGQIMFRDGVCVSSSMRTEDGRYIMFNEPCVKHIEYEGSGCKK